MKKTLNANTLKLIAIAAMTVDHLAWMLFPGYPTHPLPLAMHIIGRLTCPIMCYFVAEGFHHTKNIDRYTMRLFGFSILSHFAYLFASASFQGWQSFIPFYNGSILNQTSVLWALAWGLVMLRIACSEKIGNLGKILYILLICIAAFPSDWSCIASLCIMAFGTNRGNLKVQMGWMVFYVAIYSLVYFFCLDKVYGIVQMGVVLAIPLLGMYNGQRGSNPRWNKVMKWIFYLYYPVHLFLIGWYQYSH